MLRPQCPLGSGCPSQLHKCELGALSFKVISNLVEWSLEGHSHPDSPASKEGPPSRASPPCACGGALSSAGVRSERAPATSVPAHGLLDSAGPAFPPRLLDTEPCSLAQPACSTPHLSDPACGHVHPQRGGDCASLRAMLSVPSVRQVPGLAEVTGDFQVGRALSRAVWGVGWS